MAKLNTRTSENRQFWYRTTSIIIHPRFTTLQFLSNFRQHMLWSKPLLQRTDAPGKSTEVTYGRHSFVCHRRPLSSPSVWGRTVSRPSDDGRTRDSDTRPPCTGSRALVRKAPAHCHRKHLLHWHIFALYTHCTLVKARTCHVRHTI